MTDGSVHPCARCASVQKTCCQRAEIVVTRGDIDRITQHTGRADFWSWRPPESPAYTEQDPEDPNWVRYTVNERGDRRTLHRMPNGNCVFLGSHGCILPGEVRPLVCRLYPYAYTEQGITGLDDEYCPREMLIPKDQPKATMLTVLGMNPDDGRRWHAMLYDELRRERASDAHRSDV